MRSLYESSCDSLIRSGTSAVAAFATMDADLDNAQAALQWAQTHDGETAASLAMAIGSHLALTGSGIMGVPPKLIPTDVPLEQLPCGQVSLWELDDQPHEARSLDSCGATVGRPRDCARPGPSRCTGTMCCAG